MKRNILVGVIGGVVESILLLCISQLPYVISSAQAIYWAVALTIFGIIVSAVAILYRNLHVGAAVIRTAILCLIPLLVALLCGVGMIPRANGDSGENLASAMSTVTAAATVFWSCVIVCIGVGVYRMIK